jgi:thymidylate synthase
LKTFINAQSAFEYYYSFISLGLDFSNTKAIFNEGFYILNPLDNEINISWRKWNKEYAIKEWNWYLSGNPSGIEIAKSAKIWLNCLDEKGNVNSNYGFQWSRNNQIDYVIDELNINPQSRRASISLYDGKEHHLYKRDTICAYAINFTIVNSRLNMSVLMRSNDLWYGFCNDQYCFSLLQKMVAEKLNIEIGTYFHFVNNFHLYLNKLNKNRI